MTKNKKQGGRLKKVGWTGYSGTISGEVREAITQISAFQNRRDAGEIVDELLRKAGILELRDNLIQEYIAEQAAKAKQVEFEDKLDSDPVYHHCFAECVFEELERTHQLCSFEGALKIRGFHPAYGEVDDWRYRTRIPFEYHQAIRLYLGRNGWDAKVNKYLQSAAAAPRSAEPQLTSVTATGSSEGICF